MTHFADLQTTDISITTPDGVADGLLYHPAGDRRWPGVLFLSDIGGIREAVISYARRLASVGYAVLLPNVFYRSGAPPFFTHPVNLDDPATMQRFQTIAASMTPGAIAHDADAYVTFLHRQPAVRPGPLAVVGHCFTGAVALRMSASEGAAFGLVVSFHGGGLYTDKPNSPHLLLPQINSRLYFGHAVQDKSMSAQAIAQLEQVLSEWDGRFESDTYRGALHGWTMSDHPGYNQTQAEHAFQRLTALLAETFPKEW